MADERLTGQPHKRPWGDKSEGELLLERHFFELALGEHSDAALQDRCKSVRDGALSGPHAEAFMNSLVAWLAREVEGAASATGVRGPPIRNTVRNCVFRQFFGRLRGAHGLSRSQAYQALADWSGTAYDSIDAIIRPRGARGRRQLSREAAVIRELLRIE